MHKYSIPYNALTDEIISKEILDYYGFKLNIVHKELFRTLKDNDNNKKFIPPVKKVFIGVSEEHRIIRAYPKGRTTVVKKIVSN
jgi:hypothetical protein